MPSSSSRTTSTHLECVFSPTRPYTTCTPARSSALAQAMLACSSKRAFTSTSTATCTPRSAARMRLRTMGLSPDVRYSVILMVRTRGSSDAWRDELLDRRGEALVGVVHEHVALAQHREDALVVLGGHGQAGLRDRRPRLVLQVGAVEVVHEEQPGQVERRPRAGDVVVARGRARAAAARGSAATCPAPPRGARPGRSGGGAAPSPPPARRSSASSSRVRSALRVTRKAQRSSTTMPGKRLASCDGDHLLEGHEAGAVGQRQEAGQQRRHLHPGEDAARRTRARARARPGSATGWRCTGTDGRGRRPAA